MAIAISSTDIKYVFTQPLAPTGEGEVEGSLWYDTTLSELNVYDGVAWKPTAPATGGGNFTYLYLQGYESIVQGNWTLADGGGTYIPFYWNNTSGRAVDDEVTYKVFLHAGTYSFGGTFTTGSNKAILSVYLDANLKTTFDTNGGTADNVIMTNTGIVVATDGLYTLRLKVATSSNADWIMMIYGFWWYRTA